MIILGLTISDTLVKYGSIAGAIVAISGLGAGAWSVAKPIAQSDPMPIAGIERVNHLETQVAMSLQSVTKAQADLQRRQNYNDLALNELRIKAVRRDMDQIADDLKHHPTDKSLKEAQEQDKQDLNDLLSDHQKLRALVYPMRK